MSAEALGLIAYVVALVVILSACAALGSYLIRTDRGDQ